MTIPTILTVIALVAATSPAHAKHISLRSEGLDLSDDRPFLASYRTRGLDDPVENEVPASTHQVCRTQDCKVVAEEFLRSMNKSVDPCENFYEYTCGAWSEDTIPPSKPSWSRFMLFRHTVDHRLKGIFEAKSNHSEIRPVKQAKKWYRSCINTEKLERRGMEPIASILRQAGGWPITMDDNEWNGEEHSWQKVERHYARLTGAYTFYKIRPVLFWTPTRMMVEAPEIPLTKLILDSRNYSGNFYNMYVRLVEEAANLFVQNGAADSRKERIRKEARDIVEFEKKIYQLTRNTGLSFKRLNDFIEWYGSVTAELNIDSKAEINWRSLIQELFSMISTNVISSDRIFIYDYSYFVEFAELLKRTPARTIVNYVHWNFVARMLPYTTESARNKLFEFAKEELGVIEREPRWSECVTEMKMSHAAAYAFVNKYYPKHTQKAVKKMTKYIVNAVEDKIENSNWLDAVSKEWAKHKLKNMKMLIGFPDWYKNETKLERRYKGLTIGADYFDNTLNYMRYEALYQLRTMATMEEFDLWTIIDPITIDAVYALFINTLSIPAADFQNPLFAPQLPSNINYGIAGVVVGHEISHGFDDTGIHFGESLKAPGLSYDILGNYRQIERCFMVQFVKYFGVEKILMGVTTRGENIADSTSVQAIFEAYKKSRKQSSGGEMRLRGLEEITDDQLLFLSFASTWCTIERPKYAKKRMESANRKSYFDKDRHSPPKFRVIASVQNSKDFASVFNCPNGSPMNPVEKCNVWQTRERPNRN